MNAKRIKDRQGFTLVEVMVASGLGFTVISLVTSSFLALVSASTGTSYYQQMHADARQTFDVMGQEITAASEVTYYDPTTYFAVRVVHPDHTEHIGYYLSGTTLYRVDIDAGTVAEHSPRTHASSPLTMASTTSSTTLYPSSKSWASRRSSSSLGRR